MLQDYQSTVLGRGLGLKGSNSWEGNPEMMFTKKQDYIGHTRANLT